MARSLILRSSDGEHRVDLQNGRATVDGTAVEPARRSYAIADGDRRWVFMEGEVFEFEVVRPDRRRHKPHHGAMTAPMPATVVRINTPAGTKVKRGDILLVLEAMKMELPIRADDDGIVEFVNCEVGQLVQPGVSLIELA